MKSLRNHKFGKLGLVAAFLLLFGAAYLGGTVSASHDAAHAQTAPTTTTTTPTATQAAETKGVENGTTEATEAPGQAPEQKDTTNSAALQAQAKITVEQAKQAALAKVPGTVVSATLEDEDGVAAYVVNITPSAGGNAQEVTVNAVSGQVIAEQAGTSNEGTGGSESDGPGGSQFDGEQQGNN